MQYLIREINEGDLEQLLDLYLYLHDKSKPESSPELKALWQRIIEDPSYHIFIGELDGKLVSSCTLVIIKNLTQYTHPYALIENVVTAEAYRSHGYATALLNEASQFAKDAGCYKVMLMTGSKNQSTLRFYERAGFNSNDKTAFIKWLANI